jgi:3-hydroxy-9,10-secoandrosta-1,3,5(10)-triene-9,17-dione monooxygenase
MLQKNKQASGESGEDILDRVRMVAPKFRERAAAAEEARQLPRESVAEMLDAGIARILVPRMFGGYELGLETWFDAAREIAKADASHGWCASLIHHSHVVGMFPAQGQREVWADGPDVAIASSIHPNAKATREAGGYRVSGQGSPSASGVGHSSWSIIGAHVDEGGAPVWMFFLIPRRDYAVRDTWFTAGMRATGSNTIVTDNVFVPEARTLRVSDLRNGTGPGGAIHNNPIYRAPFYSYSSLTFVTAMLGAAQSAYKYFREWTNRSHRHGTRRCGSRRSRTPASPWGCGPSHA